MAACAIAIAVAVAAVAAATDPVFVIVRGACSAQQYTHIES